MVPTTRSVVRKAGLGGGSGGDDSGEARLRRGATPVRGGRERRAWLTLL
jgi:hypothetical protein